MNPEPPPDTATPQEPIEPPHEPESYPFWGYLDLLAFIFIALLALIVEAVALNALLPVVRIKSLYLQLPAQFILYGFLLWMLSVIFRRYYGRPFWLSLRWVPARMSVPALTACGILLAFAVMVASLLLRTPDINSPMKQLLSDKSSILLVAIFGVTLGPVCEEIIFRGFLQPLLVRSWGPAPGILGAAVPFGLLHLQEYSYSWRHGLLITLAGAAFGWMRYRTGSTKAAAIMHASYNFVFFLLLVVQQLVPHP